MFRTLIALLIFLMPFFSEAKEKICLNMIVKNESRVIRRCLDSVLPYIDYWVIVDTGSTDGTQEIIKEHLKNIPGELHEKPWKNFGENRTEAYELTKDKGDYILLMDADDTLEYEKDFQFSPLTHDAYNMWRGTKNFSYLRPQIIKANLPWKWVGVTHEYLACDHAYTSDTLEKVRYMSGDGGASSFDPKKFHKNIKLLKEGIKKEPNNVRYAFYLAESYRDAGQKGKALEWYQKRINMGGWDEEIFWSKLQIAQILKDLGLSNAIVIESLKDAHHFRPHRAEPIYYLAELYNREGNYAQAYKYLKIRELIPKPAQRDYLFNMDWVEDFGLLFQQSICAYFVGNYQESLDICDKLLTLKNLPENWRKQTELNRIFPLEKIQLEVANKENCKEEKMISSESTQQAQEIPSL